ncbi:MAG: ATP-binding protein [Cyclobacteriaceae bacterium]|nr:ATP-binding protein [Cyclobacteriaceae bacterium]
MKSLVVIFFLVAFPVLGIAQNEKNYQDSLLFALNDAANDTIRLDINRKLGFHLINSEAESALRYHQAQQVLAKKLSLKLWEADAYQQIAYCYTELDNLPAAYENYMQALKIAEDPASEKNSWKYSNFSYSKSPEEARQSIVGMIHYELSRLYTRTRFNQEALNQLFEALRIGKKWNNKKLLSLATREIGLLYSLTNKPDSAFLYFNESLLHYENSPYKTTLGSLYNKIGDYYLEKREYDSAKLYFNKGIDENAKPSTLVALSLSNQKLGELYKSIGQLDSALVYTFKGIKIAESINENFSKAAGYTQLAAIYKLQNKNPLAYDYLHKGKTLADSLNELYITRLMQFLNIGFDQKIRLQELEIDNEKTKSRIRVYSLLAGLTIIFLIAFLLYRNNRQKQRANKVLEATLSNLKSTQSQLIQSEKMASLGELTAGIAHEIQNPLNFVNNFSEVNTELIDEMQQELKAGNDSEAITISNNIKENQEKINFHGKRADTIVKGMLQHSRSSSSVKEATDINALADEYLRLAYHGLRAKDKSFNARLETDFDSSLEKINVVPQDIGRVILNLINNAFYAVSEKIKQNIPGYEPTVTVSTKKKGDKVLISVRDNGNGISQSVMDKIFQPFFTTKPTGQGTGLGLSLSYDIVKAHGGELKVETNEARLVGRGEGSEFIFSLPGNNQAK